MARRQNRGRVSRRTCGVKRACRDATPFRAAKDSWQVTGVDIVVDGGMNV